MIVVVNITILCFLFDSDLKRLLRKWDVIFYLLLVAVLFLHLVDLKIAVIIVCFDL